MEHAPKTSPAASAWSVPVTLAEITTRIAADTDLPPRKRQDVASSIKRFAELMGLPLATSPADPRAYRSRLRCFQPLAQSISVKRWQNIRSDVQFALNRYRPKPDFRGGLPIPVSEEWTDLRSRLVETFGLRSSDLSRFLSYCTLNGIAPMDVTAQTFVGFRAWMESSRLLKEPQMVVRRSIKLWNKAADAIPEWPSLLVPSPPTRDLYGMKWGELPEALRQDTERWLARISGDDLTFDDDLRASVSEATLKSYQYFVRQIMGALQRSDEQIEGIKSLGDLIKPERLRIAVTFLRSRTGKDRSSMLAHIASKAIAIARHYARFEEGEINKLRNLQHRVTPRSSGLTSKNKERLTQLDSQDNEKRLLQLPSVTFGKLDRVIEIGHREALAAQTALVVELLLFVPIRRRNLVSLNLNRHVRYQFDGRQKMIFIHIPADEVKNHVPLDFELPIETVELWEAYLERYRPRLLVGPDAGWLFPGGRPGEHKAAEQMGRNVSAFLRREIGLEFNLHLFRHTAAKLFLEEHPGNYEGLRRTLAHKKIDTTANFYAGLETGQATRHFDNTVLMRRRRLSGSYDRAGRHD